MVGLMLVVFAVMPGLADILDEDFRCTDQGCVNRALVEETHWLFVDLSLAHDEHLRYFDVPARGSNALFCERLVTHSHAFDRCTARSSSPRAAKHTIRPLPTSRWPRVAGTEATNHTTRHGT